MAAMCSVCQERLVLAKGFCSRCYQRNRNGSLRCRKCGAPKEARKGNHYCVACRMLCTAPGCTQPRRTEGTWSHGYAMCAPHYREQHRATGWGDPAYRRANKVRQYGLTAERYAEILRSQNEACAVCRRADPGPMGWTIDHDHACCPSRGRACGSCIRGILCGQCNTALGMVRDDEDRLLAMVEYLRRFRGADR